MESIEMLKGMAYDLLVTISQSQRKLQEIEQQIAELRKVEGQDEKVQEVPKDVPAK